MITLKEIAKECGVSTATVSNVLNNKKNVSDEIRQKVLDVVKERGYKLQIRPALHSRYSLHCNCKQGFRKYQAASSGFL